MSAMEFIRLVLLNKPARRPVLGFRAVRRHASTSLNGIFLEVKQPFEPSLLGAVDSWVLQSRIVGSLIWGKTG